MDIIMQILMLPQVAGGILVIALCLATIAALCVALSDENYVERE